MIISTINLKGGVGKTTTAMALATAATREGKEVELYDCDPQSSASLWAMVANDNDDPLPFQVVSANLATVRIAGKQFRKDLDKWVFIDCPPSGSIMDEASQASDFVIVPTGPGAADVVKTIETARTLTARGVFYGVLLTQVAANTLAFAKALSEIEDNDLSYFDHQVRRREALRNFFGNSFGDDLFGYEVIWDDLKQILRDDEEIHYAG
jgi:chromosome partitioning protein